MPVTPRWGNPEQTVIFLSYTQPWDWPAFDLAISEINTMLDTVQHPVNMIIEINDGLPRDIRPQRFRKAMQNFHRNIRETALVVPNDLLRWTISAFVSVVGNDNRTFFFVPDVSHALARFARPESITIKLPEKKEKVG